MKSRFEKAVEYLYNCTPQFQLIGAAAYKPGLQTAMILDLAYGSPHKKYKTIHIAGTNGKGSTAHLLASILQEAGYKVGLYTSPHLVDFRERIRVNGQKISESAIVDFVEDYKSKAIGCEPSFFEVTTIMAFDYFARENVDVAVIETGLGGRLDTTNIIEPVVSIITNISKDHVAQLGNDIEAIASEKAGIIKKGVPVVIGEASGSVAAVFQKKAMSLDAPIVFAENNSYWRGCTISNYFNIYESTPWGDVKCPLSGACQAKNATTVFAALEILGKTLDFNSIHVVDGFEHVIENTSLMGRWTIVKQGPLTLCDTGHNIGGWHYLAERLESLPRPLSMVIGFVSDKDVDHILELMPQDAYYYFTQSSVPRAMATEELAAKATQCNLNGETIAGVKKAVTKALSNTPATGSIFIGGSNFVVADFLD